MKVNPTLLSQELRAAGIPIDGCDSEGGIQFKAEATVAQRVLAEQVLAQHDAAKPSDAEKRVIAARKLIKDNFSTLSPEMKALAILINAVD